MDTADRVVVVGAGVAGLATALRLAPLPVTVIAASPPGIGAATALAQGGIAAALGPDDDADLHARDTLQAGAGLSEPAIARRVAGAAAAAVDWLLGLSAPLDRDERGAIALGLEAAHCRRRIVHAGGDKTGLMVLQTLIRAARAAPHIRIIDNLRADALLHDTGGRIAGLTVIAPAGERLMLRARAVVLATGGLGALYAATTNPLSAVGSGLALAARAGAIMRDMAFVQFHPTAIAAGPDPMPLATEALRGEGAILIDDRGERFMADVPGRELAPRDVVARAIFSRIAAGCDVFLDARLDGLEDRFPGVVALCRACGIDPVRQFIPVRPAAHYHMGGIAVDDAGRSSAAGLWACGEVASTGLHGANRLASNSLLEALAFAEWISDDIRALSDQMESFDRSEFAQNQRSRLYPCFNETRIQSSASAPASGRIEAAPSSQASTGAPARLKEIRALMDASVGVVREAGELSGAVNRLHGLVLDNDDDRALVALMVAMGALARTESRGGHCRTDCPAPDPHPRHDETTLDATMQAADNLARAQAAA